MPRSDPELVRACLAGNEQAWNELVDRYGRLVYSVARRNGLSPIDADEVFQNVFTKVIRKLSSLQNRELLAAWLISIAYRESKFVGRRSFAYDELDDTMMDDTMPLSEKLESWEQEHLVRRAVEQMDPRCSELLTALFLEPDTPSYQEISRRFRISVGSIGPIRARCFKRLEVILTKLGVASEPEEVYYAPEASDSVGA